MTYFVLARGVELGDVIELDGEAWSVVSQHDDQGAALAVMVEASRERRGRECRVIGILSIDPPP